MTVDGASAGHSPWQIYRGGRPADRSTIPYVPLAPPWRIFDGSPPGTDGAPGDTSDGSEHGGYDRSQHYEPDSRLVEMVNAAMALRRPLLLTGKPGSGKSTLAYSIARELGLGSVLHWPVNSRSTLSNALYQYDAIGRLRESNAPTPDVRPSGRSADEVGRHIRLGPLGTALLPRWKPRVLLVDEFDKSDMDLASDLLNVFENGFFQVPELIRVASEDDDEPVMVRTDDRRGQASIVRGEVLCREFPVVIITSNRERELPPAFLRRCLQHTVQQPTGAQLVSIVARQFGRDAMDRCEPIIEEFIRRRAQGDLATDQLFNACHLVLAGFDGEVVSSIPDAVLKPLGEAVA